MIPAKIVSGGSGGVYVVREQIATGAGTFADKSGTSDFTAYNLAELTLGPGGAVDVGQIVLVTCQTDNGNPPTVRYFFDHPAYAKYLS